MRTPRSAAVALVAVVAVGCGSHPRTIPSAATKARLQGDVRALTLAAARHDLPTAQTAAASLNADAAAAAATGDLSDSALRDIRTGVAKVLADLTAARVSSSSSASKVVSSPAHTATPVRASSSTPHPAPVISAPVAKPPGKAPKPPKPRKK